jgi:hypothetical protein
VVAALGISCALAAWPILLRGFVGTMFLLVICGPLERAIQRRVDRGGDEAPGAAAPKQRP